MAASYNNHLFRYLNRHWVKREMDEGKKNIYDIYTLHLVRWKDDMFMSTQKSVMDSVLRLVEKQRNGETIEQSQIKSVVDSFGMISKSPLHASSTDLVISIAWTGRV
jgi:cullin 1